MLNHNDTLSMPGVGPGSILSSAAFRMLLWTSVFAAFMVVHLPKDTVAALCPPIASFLIGHFDVAAHALGDKSAAPANMESIALRLKGIIFLASLLILFLPVVKSLSRTGFLWEKRKLVRRLVLSAITFLLLCLLIDPLRLSALHQHYSQMSVSPFDAPRGWYYRRLLMPAIAHFLGFRGDVFYYLYSTVLTFGLIFFLLGYFESQQIKIRFLHLLSIATAGFIIFNFMVVGWSEPMMFVLFLLLLFIADSDDSRLSLVALSLATHEGSVLVLVPMILFCFPGKKKLKYLTVIALYFVLYVISFRLDALLLVKSQFSLDNKIGLDWVRLYPWRAAVGWLLSYKLLWIFVFWAIYRMMKAGEFRAASAVFSLSILAPALINILAVDVYRHVAEGFIGLLIAYTYLMKLGYGDRLFVKIIMALNILVPSVYIGTNSGFRFKPGLYLWFANLTGLHSWMAKF
jgi:hypothetical protein